MWYHRPAENSYGVTWRRNLMDSSRITSTLWHHRRGLLWYHRSAEDSYAAPGRRSAGVHARAAKSGSAGSLTEKRGSCLSGAVADDRWQCRGLAVRIREQCLDSWGWAGTESRRPWSRRGVNFERHPLSAGSVRVTRQDCVAVSASRSFDR